MNFIGCIILLYIDIQSFKLPVTVAHTGCPKNKHHLENYRFYTMVIVIKLLSVMSWPIAVLLLATCIKYVRRSMGGQCRNLFILYYPIHIWVSRECSYMKYSIQFQDHKISIDIRKICKCF